MEAGPRHAEIVIKELGLRDAQASRVPGTTAPAPKKDKDEDEDVEKVQLLCEESFVDSLARETGFKFDEFINAEHELDINAEESDV